MTDEHLACQQNVLTAIRDYHADVKRRLDLCEDAVRRHEIAISGIPGDDTVPGLNIEVQGLRQFRERVRLGVGAAWAALLTMATVLWKR
jgi:hypothetical protein